MKKGICRVAGTDDSRTDMRESGSKSYDVRYFQCAGQEAKAAILKLISSQNYGKQKKRDMNTLKS